MAVVVQFNHDQTRRFHNATAWFDDDHYLFIYENDNKKMPIGTFAPGVWLAVWTEKSQFSDLCASLPVKPFGEFLEQLFHNLQT